MSEDWILAYGEATAAVNLAPESPYTHPQRFTICYHSELSECAVAEVLQFLKLRRQAARRNVSTRAMLKFMQDLAGSMAAWNSKKLLRRFRKPFASN